MKFQVKSNKVPMQMSPPLAQHRGQCEGIKHNCILSPLKTLPYLPVKPQVSLPW